MADRLQWRVLASNAEAITLQQFECTEPWPRTPGGRRLPQHPRRWEWDAQRHVRNLRQLMRTGDRVLVGVDTSTGTNIIAAVLHLRFHENAGSRLVVFLEVGAVAMSHRGQHRPYIGDEIMAIAESEACAAMKERGCTSLVMAGFIHTRNNASMHMASRNNWEPLESLQDDYVRWGRHLA